jgi:ATP-dependent DNA ligase
MRTLIEKFLSSTIKILWDVLGAKNTVEDINIKQLLVKQLRLALVEGASKDQMRSGTVKTSTKELRCIVSDLMKLRRIALNMPSEERKALFLVLLVVLATALLGSENVEKLFKEVSNDECQEQPK